MKYLIMILAFQLISCVEKEKKQGETKEQTEVKVEEPVKQEPLFAPKLILSNITFNYYTGRSAAIHGEGVKMTLTIKNESDIGIKRVYFEGTYLYKGRSYKHSENINYEFRRGLESGETQNIAMRPSRLSDWNKKIKRGDQGDFSLEVLAIEDYNGNKRK